LDESTGKKSHNPKLPAGFLPIVFEESGDPVIGRSGDLKNLTTDDTDWTDFH
jgi:hypothetical protein